MAISLSLDETECFINELQSDINKKFQDFFEHQVRQENGYFDNIDSPTFMMEEVFDYPKSPNYTPAWIKHYTPPNTPTDLNQIFKSDDEDDDIVYLGTFPSQQTKVNKINQLLILLYF